jgi:hypothetical protein
VIFDPARHTNKKGDPKSDRPCFCPILAGEAQCAGEGFLWTAGFGAAFTSKAPLSMVIKNGFGV